MQNGCTYQDFVDCGPEEGFNGESGALEYLEWMSRTEMAFGLRNCAITHRCNRLGHSIWSCHEETRLETPVRVKNPMINRMACFECGSQDHVQKACPQRNGSAGQDTESTSEPVWRKTYVTDADGSQWEIPILGVMKE
jgi:hypothetical protein